MKANELMFGDWVFLKNGKVLQTCKVTVIGNATQNRNMHRYDPVCFSNNAKTVGLVVQLWIIVVPLYWFAIFCDRCMYWFEKKE